MVALCRRGEFLHHFPRGEARRPEVDTTVSTCRASTRSSHRRRMTLCESAYASPPILGTRARLAASSDLTSEVHTDFLMRLNPASKMSREIRTMPVNDAVAEHERVHVGS